MHHLVSFRPAFRCFAAGCLSILADNIRTSLKIHSQVYEMIQFVYYLNLVFFLPNCACLTQLLNVLNIILLFFSFSISM